MKITSKRYYDSTSHIVELQSSELRLDDTPGIGKESISTGYLGSSPDEVTCSE